VMTAADYATWYKSAGGAPDGGGGGAPQNPDASALATFTDYGCGGCHTFTAAKATGKIGPNLDNLKPHADLVGQSLVDYVTIAVSDPNDYVPAGAQEGVMPADFVSSIPPDKFNELIKYLVDNQK
jgi:hypothetical protein